MIYYYYDLSYSIKKGYLCIYSYNNEKQNFVGSKINTKIIIKLYQTTSFICEISGNKF